MIRELYCGCVIENDTIILTSCKWARRIHTRFWEMRQCFPGWFTLIAESKAMTEHLQVPRGTPIEINGAEL